MSEGRIVATIEPNPHGDRPLFTIVRRWDVPPGPDVRPCDHPRFVLDEQWSTVTCGECGERIDAFAALLKYAEWYNEMERRRGQMEAAERRLLVESLRRLKRLRDTTPEEVAEIEATLDWRIRPSIQELRELERRVEANVQRRRDERIQQRDQP